MKKLGVVVADRITKQKGMLTNLFVNLNREFVYLFQPKGLNPKTGHPVKKLWCVESRIDGPDVPQPDLPMDVLGTQVEDIGTGFKGTATGINLHINGCVHVAVQPAGCLQDTGDTIEDYDFDIRRLKGSAIKPMSEAALDASKKDKPSPERCPSPNRRID